MTDWATISSLATAGGTLVLAPRHLLRGPVVEPLGARRGAQPAGGVGRSGPTSCRPRRRPTSSSTRTA